MKYVLVVLTFFALALSHSSAPAAEQTPFEKLESLYNQAGPAHLTDIPTYMQASQGKWHMRVIESVKPNTKLEEVKVDGRYVIRIHVSLLTKAGTPAAGPEFPGTADVFSETDVVLLSGLQANNEANQRLEEKAAVDFVKQIERKITSEQRADTYRQVSTLRNGNSMTEDFRIMNKIIYTKQTLNLARHPAEVTYSYLWTE